MKTTGDFKVDNEIDSVSMNCNQPRCIVKHAPFVSILLVQISGKLMT